MVPQSGLEYRVLLSLLKAPEYYTIVTVLWTYYRSLSLRLHCHFPMMKQWWNIHLEKENEEKGILLEYQHWEVTAIAISFSIPSSTFSSTLSSLQRDEKTIHSVYGNSAGEVDHVSLDPHTPSQARSSVFVVTIHTSSQISASFWIKKNVKSDLCMFH